jgi:hypothetical protein
LVLVVLVVLVELVQQVVALMQFRGSVSRFSFLVLFGGASNGRFRTGNKWDFWQVAAGNTTTLYTAVTSDTFGCQLAVSSSSVRQGTAGNSGLAGRLGGAAGGAGRWENILPPTAGGRWRKVL